MKHLRRFFSLLLVFLLLCSLLCLGAGAREGNDLFWQLSEDGTLTISGTGEMPSYENGSPWDTDLVVSLVVEEGITAIGDYAFAGCTSMTQAVLPNSLTAIGDGAFQNCRKLTHLDIPQAVTEIGDYAFAGCRKLENPVLPQGITVLSAHVFDGCYELLEMDIPQGVTVIEEGAFFMSGLAQVTIPDSVTTIGQEAFSSTGLEQVTLPDSVLSLGAYLFQNCGGLTEVTLPQGLTVIPVGCFEGCGSLVQVNIPEGVTTIGAEAFNVCSSLTALTVPSSVTQIGDYAYGYYYTTDYDEDDNFVYIWNLVPGATITGVPGSAAEEYALQNDLNFSPLAAQPEDPPTATQSPDPSPVPSDSPDEVHSPALTYPVVSFSDVAQEAYYAEAVAWAVDAGITIGTSPLTFSPEDGCTREQIVMFLWRMAGEPAPTAVEPPFIDVSTDDACYSAVLWAYENDITTGTTENTFTPDAACTRSQAVTFLWRWVGCPAGSGGSPFADVASGSYYEAAVNWAVSTGVTTGTGESTFSPDDTCTRGQIVTFLYRNRTFS